MYYDFSILGVSGDTVYLPPQTDDATLRYLPMTRAFQEQIKFVKATSDEYELILRQRGGFRTLAAVFAKPDMAWSVDHEQRLRPYVMLFRMPLLLSIWAVIQIAFATGNMSMLSPSGVRRYQETHMQLQHQTVYAVAAKIFRSPYGVTYLEQDSSRMWIGLRGDGELLLLGQDGENNL